MKKLLLSLSLVLITGINAETITTENLFDDPYNDFLDGKYEYPNIHMHGDGSYDPYIYTGASLNYRDSAVAEHQINLDKLTYEITQVNYGYKYYSNQSGEVAIAIALIDDDGTMIDDAIMEYDIITGQWVNIDRIYNDMEKLNLTKEIWMGVAGSSDRNGTDDIRIGDIYMTYDYQEIPLDLITDPVYDIAKVDIKYDLDASGMPKIDEIKVEVKVDEVKVDTPAPTVAQPVQQPVTQPSTTTVQKKTETKKQTAKKETKGNKKNESKQTTNTRNQRDIENFTTASMVSSMVDSSTGGSVNGFFSTNGMDLLSSGGIDLVDTIQLIEPTFYDEPDFYESEILLTDTLKFNNIDFYKETNWYGSNTKFY